MKKKILAAFLALTLAFALSFSVYAQDESDVTEHEFTYSVTTAQKFCSLQFEVTFDDDVYTFVSCSSVMESVYLGTLNVIEKDTYVNNGRTFAKAGVYCNVSISKDKIDFTTETMIIDLVLSGAKNVSSMPKMTIVALADTVRVDNIVEGVPHSNIGYTYKAEFDGEVISSGTVEDDWVFTEEEETEPPTDAPTEEATVAPTDTPTNAPTDAPTDSPTDNSTDTPTVSPTDAPTAPADTPTESGGTASTENPTDEITSYVCGDADLNGKVQINDATHLQRWLALLEEFSDIQMLAADVSGNGKPTVEDVTFIQRWLALLSAPENIGKTIPVLTE